MNRPKVAGRLSPADWAGIHTARNARRVRENPRGRAARHALLNAAVRIFAEQGYRGASVRRIISAAGANLGAVSYHFGGKRGLYETLSAAALGATCASFQKLPPGAKDPVEMMGRVVRRIMACVREGHEGPCPWRLLARETLEPTPVLSMLEKSVLIPTLGLLGVLLRLVVPSSSVESRAEAAGFVILRCLCRHFAPWMARLGEAGAPRGLDIEAKRVTESAIRLAGGL